MSNQTAIHREEKSSMNNQYKAVKEMRRLTSPFPESTAVKDWKAQGKRVIGYVGPAVPEEMIHAAKMLPMRVSCDNEPVPTNTVDAYLSAPVSTFARSVFQTVLDGNGISWMERSPPSSTRAPAGCTTTGWPTSRAPTWMPSTCRSSRPSNAVEMYLADLEDWRDRGIEFRGARIVDRDLPEIHRGLQTTVVS